HLANPISECGNHFIDGAYIYCKIFVQIGFLEGLENLLDNLLSSAWCVTSKQPIVFYNQLIEKVKQLDQRLNRTSGYILSSLEELKGFQQLCQQISQTAVSQPYLELGELEELQLIYPLQRLKLHTWDFFYHKIVHWTAHERQVLADALLAIQDNKAANFDTGALYGQLFIYAGDLEAEVLLKDFDFIDNGLPKSAVFLDDLRWRLERLEGKTKISRTFEEEYQLIDKLYSEAIE
ncbi:MAG: hypothetical protein ACRBFS_02110, partial [Aureispira sp.]